MEKQQRKHIKTALCIIFILVLAAAGLSSLKLQSVSSYEKERAQTAAQLGLAPADPEAQQIPVEANEERSSDQKKQNITKSGNGKDKKQLAKNSGKKNAAKENSREANPNTNTKNKNKKGTGYPDKRQKKNVQKSGNSSGEKTGSKKPSSGGSSSDAAHSPNNSSGEAQSAGGSGADTPASSDTGSEGGSQPAISPSSTAVPTPSPQSADEITCTIQIRCDALLEHKEKIDSALWEYLPSDGMILPETTVSIAKGSSVYDVLAQVCKAAQIHIDADYTPLYKSYYIQGISHLYEKQAGNMSGWIYMVNGKAPDIGASGYTISNGDKIVWNYTLNGKKS